MRTVLVGMFLVLLGTTAAEAACHKYSRWYYPWPQRCSVKVTQANYEPEKLPIIPPLPPSKDEEADIPLPDLSGAWTGNDKELQEQLDRKRALILLLQK